MARDDGTARGERVWDPAIRVFHWALAVFVCTSWALGEWGPSIMTWHFWSGYAIAGLLAFRLVWGVAGPATARFAQFLAGPVTVARYVATVPRRAPSRWHGHNPLGGWAVAVMLLLLIGQVTTGLVADPDDYINIGPLAHLVPEDVRFAAAAWHGRIATALLWVVILHVAAIAFYRVWKREDLVTPMITGRKPPRG